jgi:hypothetical protein
MTRGRRVEGHVGTLIRTYLDAGRLSCTQIARELGLSHMTVYRIRLNYDLFNAPYPPKCVVTGRPQAFTHAQQEVGVTDIVIMLLLTVTVHPCLLRR